MTACVDNKEKKGGAAKAVSATLAGVLAVGMVPAVAFAETVEGSEEAEGDIELLAQTDEQAFNSGKISAYKAGAGLTDTYVAGTRTTGPVPTTVEQNGDGLATIDVTTFYKPGDTTANGTVYYAYIDLDDNAGQAPGVQFKFADGTNVTGSFASDLSKPGDYALVVFRNGGTGLDFVEQAEKFTVKAADLENAVITFGENETEKSIVFNNAEYDFNGKDSTGDNDLHVYLNGVNIDDLVDVEIKTTDTRTHADALYAGSYYAKIDGKANTIYAEDTNNYVEFEIEAFDLSTAAVVLKDVPAKEAGADYVTDIVSINGASDHWAITNNFLQLVDYTPDPEGKGTYTATVEEKPGLSKELAASIENTTTASYYVVDEVLGEGDLSFSYDGNWAYQYDSDPLIIDYSASKFASKPGETSNSFDASKIKVSLGNDHAFADKTTDVEASEYDVVVENITTHEVGGIEMLQQTGEYKVYAVLDAAAIDYQYAGASRAMTVKVTQGDVVEAGVTFAYKGEAVTAITSPMMKYTGEDQFGDITITVKTTQGKVVDPSEYTVTITKENEYGDDVEVDGIVGAGDYVITVSSDKYTFKTNEGEGKGDTLAVHVDQLVPEKVRVAGELTIKAPAGEFGHGEAAKPVDTYTNPFLPYTGSEITTTIEYMVKDAAGNEIWKTLPADQYTIAKIGYNAKISENYSTANVDAVKEVGKYWLDVEEAFASAAAGQNFDLPEQDTITYVSDAQWFYDVTGDAWYYDEVLTAANNGWIKGFNNSGFYMPNDSLKRGDVCVILARMAGVSLSIDENGGVADKYYETPFSDVDGNLYYAEAIAWAANTGVVTGYDGTTEFCPEQPVTREAFATMLARYAKNLGVDTTAGAGAADSYADANAVSWWAEDAVDWAVSAGIMGVDTSVLAPTANISRAETAAMIVRL